ncbi:MAG: potassium uptake system protein, partial [Candidatus Omnitrophica bacterium CG_4_9_14_0_2_um_filter_42_8]
MRQFAVIGLGRFGLSVAKTLTEQGCQVLAIDKDEALVQD